MLESYWEISFKLDLVLMYSATVLSHQSQQYVLTYDSNFVEHLHIVIISQGYYNKRFFIPIAFLCAK